jgi:hypothetical protein
MLRTFRFPVPAVGTSLQDLTSGELDRCNGLLLQTPMDNANVVFFGEKGREFAYLVNGASAGVDLHNARDIFVKGTVPDELIVLAY